VGNPPPHRDYVTARASFDGLKTERVLFWLD